MHKLLDENGLIRCERVIKILNRLCNGKYTYEIQQSKTTNSVYVRIMSGDDRVSFRISDHAKPQETNVSITYRSFPVGKHTKEETLERFIQNRISTLKKRNNRTTAKNFTIWGEN